MPDGIRGETELAVIYSDGIQVMFASYGAGQGFPYPALPATFPFMQPDCAHGICASSCCQVVLLEVERDSFAVVERQSLVHAVLERE